jgi:hypothetical protein
MHRYAVILTHNRPELLRETWAAIGPQVDMVLIMDNASEPPVNFEQFHGDPWLTMVLTVPDQPPNLSALWNKGIEIMMRQHVLQVDEAAPPARVAVLCDDAPPPPGWFDAVGAAMASTGAALGCSAAEPFGWRGEPVLKVERDSDLAKRLTGWAWVIDPVSPVRADERFEWWWGDTDLDWQARAAGGMVIIGDHEVPNRRPNEFSGRPGQAAQIAADSQRFVDKYGWRPW